MTEIKPFYNLKYDQVFKAVVLKDEDYRFLNLILSDILEKEVEVINYEYSEIPIDNIRDKIKMLDVIVRTEDSEKINVEINTNFDNIIKERNLMYYLSLCLNKYNYSKKISKSKKGKNLKWENINKIIQINLNHNLLGNEPKEEIRIINTATNKIYYEDFKIINVNLERYKRLCYDKNIKGVKDHLYLVLLTANEEELKELGRQDLIAKEVGEKVLGLNDGGDLMNQEELELDAKYVYMLRMEKAEKEGHRKGKREGKIEGIKENQINIVNELLKRNISLKEIADITKLSEEEIIKIQGNK